MINKVLGNLMELIRPKVKVEKCLFKKCDSCRGVVLKTTTRSEHGKDVEYSCSYCYKPL